MKRVLLTLVLVFMCVPGFVYAQQAQLNLIDDAGTSLTVTPNSPGPGENITARLESTTIDLHSANISWSVNGVILESGKGITSISVATGNIGSRVLIVATITYQSGRVTKIFDFTIGSVDLMWEGGGYTTPFYESRSLWARQGQIRLLAIPNTGKNPGTLLYKWTVDGQVQSGSSGVGKKSFSIFDTILSLPRNISVSVWEDPETKLAEASVTLRPIAPALLVYENSPLYGFLFNKAVVGIYPMSDPEITLAAFPMFFSADNKASRAMEYSWSNSSGRSSGNSVTYRAPESKGVANVSVSAKHINNLLQSAATNFTIEFNKQ